MTRRQRLNVLIAVNGIGFVLCGTALGGLLKADIVPWYGFAGIAFLFLGIVVPVYREFVAIRDGFDSVQREAMRAIKHRRGEKNYQDVFDNDAVQSAFERITNRSGISVLFTVAGWGLIITEGVMWVLRP